jgi:hypothetical protein
VSPSTLLLTHAAATWFMTGLIWVIQVVHYPLFARVGAEGYRDYQLGNQPLISLIVGPAMLVEALATAAILLTRRDGPAFAAAALLAIIWASTAFLQVPMHNALANGFDAQAHARLVDTNWIRTVAWTARGVLALYFLRATA